MIKDGYSICLNEWAIDAQTRNELPLLVIISSLSAKTGACFASNKFFADLLGFDEATISRKISKLVELGVIDAAYEKRGFQVVKRVLRLTKMSSDGLQKCHPTVDENVKYKNTSIKNKNLIDAQFDEFWQKYPNKKSKQKAESIFGKLLASNSVTFAELMSGLDRYCQFIKQKDVQREYIKHPTTWLNQGCWSDEYGTAGKMPESWWRG